MFKPNGTPNEDFGEHFYQEIEKYEGKQYGKHRVILQRIMVGVLILVVVVFLCGVYVLIRCF